VVVRVKRRSLINKIENGMNTIGHEKSLINKIENEMNFKHWT